LEDFVGAEEICINALGTFQNNEKIRQLLSDVELAKCRAAATKRFPGPIYLEWLTWFHAQIKPENYLEIGVESGESLQLARPPTRAVGIDPEIKIIHQQEAWVKLFKLTSDDFFAANDPQKVFGTGIINLAFIDGLHTFDQALKDFINIELYSNTESVVLFHDIFPVTPVTASRNHNSIFWVGDTWKVMLILLKHRPDLKIFTIPTYPSGLGVVTGLNRDSRILKKDFELFLREAMEIESFPLEIDKQLRVVKNDFCTVAQLLGLEKTNTNCA
jgi:hypothetical protein